LKKIDIPPTLVGTGFIKCFPCRLACVIGIFIGWRNLRADSSMRHFNHSIRPAQMFQMSRRQLLMLIHAVILSLRTVEVSVIVRRTESSRECESSSNT